jgi:chain length determinant protein (polysaccharide antigen chain regulator)
MGIQKQESKIEISINDLNLIDFLSIIWRNRLLVLFSTGICLAFGISDIIITNPVFEASGYISAPLKSDLVFLNQGRFSGKNSLFPSYHVSDVYDVFTRVLQDESTKRQFFNEIFLPSHNEQAVPFPKEKLYEIFSNALSIKSLPSSQIISVVSLHNYLVKYKGSLPEKNAILVRDYIDFSKMKAQKMMLSDVDARRNLVLRNLSDEIDVIRSTANAARLDRIKQLQEAIKEAQVVGSFLPSGSFVYDLSNPTLMYLRGTKALQAEKKYLLSRNALNFIGFNSMKLREAEARFNLYKKMVVKPEQIVMFRLDNEITKSSIPVAPKKKLIIVIALFIGLFVGVILALIRKPIFLILQSR